jgi:FMN-dependent NADH-azoreductase
VIGAPLYNFTTSSQLKAWFDRILVAGETFSYSESGQERLAGDKRIIVAVARGGVYAEGPPFASFEHAETLLRSLLSFIGISGPEFIVAEELATGEQARQANSNHVSKDIILSGSSKAPGSRPTLDNIWSGSKPTEDAASAYPRSVALLINRFP